MGYTKSYPTPVNRDLLFEEFVAADIQANFAVDYIEVTDATPEATTDGIIAAHDGTQQTTAQQRQADKQSILALATQAKNFTSEIKAIWSAVVNADYNTTDTDTRFTNIRNAVSAQGTGFKNALHTALESETGITTAVLDATPTAIQKQAYNQFIRSFCLTWAFMIALG